MVVRTRSSGLVATTKNTRKDSAEGQATMSRIDIRQSGNITSSITIFNGKKVLFSYVYTRSICQDAFRTLLFSLSGSFFPIDNPPYLIVMRITRDGHRGSYSLIRKAGDFPHV